MSSTTDNEQRFAYLLSPEFQIVNTAGKPLTGGWIEVYIHGTRVKYYCFSDFDGTLHPFQIPLDSLGSNIVLASPTHAYDIYIYNKFGALVMSRYNVVPACNAADIVEDVVVIDSPDETINVECDGGSNWHLTVNTDLIATNEQLASVSGDLQDQIDGKKDIQQPYAASGTVTQTITKIEQNENGEIEVTYTNIELPPEVPNINIISPSGTIDVTSNTDPTTNTKTFKIDVHNNYMQHFIGYYGPTRYEDRQPDTTEAYYLNVNNWSNYEYEGDFIYNNWQGDNNPWFYVNPGLYMVHAVVHYAMASGSLVNEDKYIKVATGQHNGWEDGTRYKDFSQEAQLTDGSITVNFIRKVDEHNGGIEIAPYLPYGVSYAFIHEIQIVKLDSIAFDNGGTGPRYSPGYGINIPDYTIEIDPTVVVTHNYFTTAINLIQEEINEINTTIQNVTGDITELSETVTNIVGVTGDFATNEDLQIVSGAIPESQEVEFQELDVDSLATTEYVDNRIASAAGDVYEAGQYISIDNSVISVTGVQPEGDYATNADLQTVSAAIPESEDVEFEEVDLAQFAQASAVTVIQNEINNVTGDIHNINEAITNIIGATGDYATEEYVDEAIAAVSGEQQQSDWTQDDDTKVDYIKHKPREVNLVAGDNIAIEQDGLDVIISATGIGDVYEAGQYISIQNGTISVTGLDDSDTFFATVGSTTWQTVKDAYDAGKRIFAVTSGNSILPLAEYYSSRFYFSSTVRRTGINNTSPSYIAYTLYNDRGWIDRSGDLQANWNESDNSAASYIRNKPAIPQVELNNNDQVTAIDGHTLAGGSFEQVNSDWNATSGVAEILNRPDVFQLIAGDNIDITPSGNDLVISAESDVTKAYVDEQIAVATGMIPEDTVTHAELNDAIDAATGMIPEAQVNADWLATSGKAEILNKPQEEAVEFEEVNLSDYALASAIPDVSHFVTQQDIDDTVAPVQSQVDTLAAATGDYLQSSDLNGYATEAYVDESVTSVQTQIDDLAAATGDYLTEQVNSDWNATSGVAEILNKPESEEVEFEEIDLSDYALASAIPSLAGYATETYVDTQIAAVTGIIPSDAVTEQELSDAINAATGMIPPVQAQIDDLVAATGDYLTEQVNADWNAASGVAEILNKPQAEEVTFEELNLNDYALASAIPSLEGYATEAYVDAAISAVSGGTFEQVNSDWDATSGVAEILNKPEVVDITVGNVIAGDNISITASGDDIVISSTGGGSFTQVNADWNATSGVAEILNKPTEKNLVAGTNVTITETNDEVTIETTEIASGAELVAGSGINIEEVNGNVRISQDETVLWSGTFSGSTGSSNYITLSEATTKFDTIEITMGGGYKTKLRYDGSATTWQVFSPYVNGAANTVIYAGMYTVTNNGTQVYSQPWAVINQSGWTTDTDMNVGEQQLTKVVGINRMSN